MRTLPDKIVMPSENASYSPIIPYFIAKDLMPSRVVFPAHDQPARDCYNYEARVHLVSQRDGTGWILTGLPREADPVQEDSSMVEAKSDEPCD